MSFSVGNTTKNQAFHASPGQVTLSVSAASLLIVQPSMTSLSGAGAALTLASVTSTNLTFTKLGAQSRHDVNIGAGATWHRQEVWWAFCPNALTSEVISCNVTASGSPNTGCILATECQGLPNPTVFFDTNVSLPVLASNDNSGPSATGITTTSGTPIGLWFFSSSFANSTPNSPGSWTQANIGSDPGGSTQANVDFYYQVFSSAQSSATFSSSTSTRNWNIIAHALSNIPTTGSYASLVAS